MIDYKLISALSAVIEFGGFEKAANKLHISQSAISQRIKLLESQMGRQLLVRSNPPVATAMGVKLDMHWKRILILEQELGIEESGGQKLTAKIAVNADSLATWFAEALAIVSDKLSLELQVEDQDVGLQRMKNGDVLACLCSSEHPVNGANADYVGTMNYFACASQEFVEKYRLIDCIENLSNAPCLVYNHDDQLQFRYLQQLGLTKSENIHYCPSSEGFVKMALAGCGYGLLPEIQIEPLLASGELVKLLPEKYLRIPLYWHSWRNGGTLMQQLKLEVLRTGKRYLS